MTEPNPDILTTEQAANRVKATPRTLRTWRSKFGCPAFRKIGRTVYYHADEVDRAVRFAFGVATDEDRQMIASRRKGAKL